MMLDRQQDETQRENESLLPAYLRPTEQAGRVYGTLSYNRRSKCGW